MKFSALFAGLLLASVLFVSCQKSNFNYSSDYVRSYTKWLSFKDSSYNCYRYVVAGGSWTGMGWITEITVFKGVIIQRYFKMTPPPGNTSIPITDAFEWTESQDQLNTHVNTNAAETITLDGIYARAKNDWLVKRDNAKTYFETRNRGMISLCGYIDNGCQDDCFTGVTVTSIQPI